MAGFSASDLRSANSGRLVNIQDDLREASNNAEDNERLKRAADTAAKLAGEGIDLFKDDIVATNELREQYIEFAEETLEQTLARLEAEYKSTLFCVKKFVDNSGMCGMGMGMGNEYSECGALQLTAEEIMALCEVLPTIEDDDQNKYENNMPCVVEDLNKKLEGTGTTFSYNDGDDFITLTRADGSTEKIYDANGNGMLDIKDYDFCSALKEARAFAETIATEVSVAKALATQEISQINATADKQIQEDQQGITVKEGEKTEAEREAEKFLGELEKWLSVKAGKEQELILATDTIQNENGEDQTVYVIRMNGQDFYAAVKEGEVDNTKIDESKVFLVLANGATSDVSVSEARQASKDGEFDASLYKTSSKKVYSRKQEATPPAGDSKPEGEGAA